MSGVDPEKASAAERRAEAQALALRASVLAVYERLGHALRRRDMGLAADLFAKGAALLPVEQAAEASDKPAPKAAPKAERKPTAKSDKEDK